MGSYLSREVRNVFLRTKYNHVHVLKILAYLLFGYLCLTTFSKVGQSLKRIIRHKLTWMILPHGRYSIYLFIDSTSLPVSHGVVQGSILGPVLFLNFTNDLPSHVPCGKLVMYADDTQFLNACPRESLSEHSADLENMLSVVQAWYHQNRLKVNPCKTELVFLGADRSGECFRIFS